MLNPLFETVTITDQVNGVDVEIVIREMTYGESKTLPHQILETHIALLKSDAPALTRSLEKILDRFVTVKANGQAISMDDLPMAVIGRVVGEFIALNFTPSKVQVWRSVWESAIQIIQARPNPGIQPTPKE